MTVITVHQKPGYVHGLGLQDALFKACHPEASERDVIEKRSEITIDPSSLCEDGNTSTETMHVVVTGGLDAELGSRLYNAALGVMRASAPPGRKRPEVHVHFLAAL